MLPPRFREGNLEEYHRGREQAFGNKLRQRGADRAVILGGIEE